MQTFVEAKGWKLSLTVYFLNNVCYYELYWGANSELPKQNSPSSSLNIQPDN